ncbi:MAG: IS200/IS605 family transposase [Nanoarchaeota archaeon]|nr:IS200/IS605 family transposase [Nanoarchaeota archaeon]MBU4452394.1 IS200/IS605 family transposase [Nanoarchaeota archaeon]MCG2723330.1 IS200/IS605 family transposase [archaeon]
MNRVSSDLKSCSHSKGQNWYHVIIIPRARYPVFRYEPTKRLCEEGIKQVCKNNCIDLFTFEVMPDHVHLFISCPPRKSILRICAVIKGGTFHYIRDKMPSLQRYLRLWSRGVFYRSIGSVSADAVKNYIDNSKGNQWKKTREMQETLF